MREEDKLYELIVKELISDISEQEREKLQSSFAFNPEAKSKYKTIEKYWKNYFPRVKTNQAVQKAEQKLGFSDKSGKSVNLFQLYKIAIAAVLIISLSYISFHRFRINPKYLLMNTLPAREKLKI